MKPAYPTKRMSRIAMLMSCVLISGALPNGVFALSADEAYKAVADLLVSSQYSSGEWVGEEDFTGSIVAGLVRAYEVTSTAEYLTAAEIGAGYILDVAGGNFFGDEAYAMARLSEVTGEPAYADVVRQFYDSLDTETYIDGFAETDHSNAVFYIAHHAVAAHKVGAMNAAAWRAALVKHLCLIDDDLAYFPVMSLGVATWALAQTGPMDATVLDPEGLGQSRWRQVKMSDLPDVLSGHMELSGSHEGSFCHRFDHMPAGPGFESGGYTEDTVFGLLGLIAANEAGWNFDQEIRNATDALVAAVSPSGFVWEHVVLRTGLASVHWTYGGELLETMQIKVDSGPVPLGDSVETQSN